ncbi:hypothetical protein D3C81_2104370 [compost metagenome]
MPVRTVEALKDSIRKLVEEPALLIQLSTENVERIKEWDWSIQAAKFGQYFESLTAIDSSIRE